MGSPHFFFKKSIKFTLCAYSLEIKKKEDDHDEQIQQVKF